MKARRFEGPEGSSARTSRAGGFREAQQLVSRACNSRHFNCPLRQRLQQNKLTIRTALTFNSLTDRPTTAHLSHVGNSTGTLSGGRRPRPLNYWPAAGDRPTTSSGTASTSPPSSAVPRSPTSSRASAGGSLLAVVRGAPKEEWLNKNTNNKLTNHPNEPSLRPRPAMSEDRFDARDPLPYGSSDRRA